MRRGPCNRFGKEPLSLCVNVSMTVLESLAAFDPESLHQLEPSSSYAQHDSIIEAAV